MAIKAIRKSENYIYPKVLESLLRTEITTRHGSSLKHIFMQISMKQFKTKIVFNKNPVENTGHDLWRLILWASHAFSLGKKWHNIFKFWWEPDIFRTKENTSHVPSCKQTIVQWTCVEHIALQNGVFQQ